MPSRAGSQNKNRQFLMNRMKDMLGDDFDPVVNMAKNAAKIQEIADVEGSIENYSDALSAWDKVAPYVAAKLKAVEISQAVDDETGETKEWKITVKKADA